MRLAADNKRILSTQWIMNTMDYGRASSLCCRQDYLDMLLSVRSANAVSDKVQLLHTPPGLPAAFEGMGISAVVPAAGV